MRDKMCSDVVEMAARCRLPAEPVSPVGRSAFKATRPAPAPGNPTIAGVGVAVPTPSHHSCQYSTPRTLELLSDRLQCANLSRDLMGAS